MEATKTFNYIPAQPDFYTVELLDNGPKYHLDPIIGWEIGSDLKPNGTVDCTFVYPITVEGPQTNAAIVYPEGAVCVPMEGVFGSVDEWVKNEMKLQQKDGNTPD